MNAGLSFFKVVEVVIYHKLYDFTGLVLGGYTDKTYIYDLLPVCYVYNEPS